MNGIKSEKSIFSFEPPDRFFTCWYSCWLALFFVYLPSTIASRLSLTVMYFRSEFDFRASPVVFFHTLRSWSAGAYQSR